MRTLSGDPPGRAAVPPSFEEPPGQRLRVRFVVLLVAMGSLANVEAMAGLHLGTVGPLPGLFLCVVAPTVLLRTFLWNGLEPVARTVLAFASVLLGLMLAGLVLDAGLPLLGDNRPLSPVPLLLTVDVVTAVLLLWCYRRSRSRSDENGPAPVARGVRRPRRVTATLVVAAGTVALAAMGAVRLNNNGGDAAGLVALGLVCALAVVLLWSGHAFTSGEIALVLFAIAASILLLIAMRGWFITGPDSLGEYANYRAVEAAARWVPQSSSTAYNACLSVTILPQVLVGVTGISSVWVWKSIFPLFFSVTPVFVFLIAKTVANLRTAILAALVFVTFPAFVYSLAFAARQEIAFIFVGAAVLLMRSRPSRQRAILLTLALTGMILSHYSTCYYFFTTGVIGYVAYYILRLATDGAPRISPRHMIRKRYRITKPALLKSAPPPYGIPLRLLFVFVLGLLLWEGPVNGITGDVTRVATSAYHDVIGGRVAAPPTVTRSRSGVRVVGSTSLQTYAAQAERSAASPGAGSGYYPQRPLNRYQVSEVDLVNLPDTAIGRWLNAQGVSPKDLNAGIRSLIARGLEVLAVAGFLSVFVRRGRLLDFVSFGLGNLVVLAAILAVPSLTVNYGAARGFQEALFVLAPLVAIGLVRGLALVRIPRSGDVAAAVAVGAMASLTGLLPQLTGGYVAQVDLSNTGIFIANYYTTPEEIAAVRWASGDRVLALQVNTYLADRLSNFTQLPIINDDFPDVVRRNATVLFGTTTVRTGADLVEGPISYSYPMKLLQQLKSKVYASGGAAVYH